jgi:phosphatidylglycerophosphatase C
VNPPLRPTLAVFDFDGTLTTYDSSLPFIDFARGRARLVRSLALNLPGLAFDVVAAAAGEARAGDRRISVRGRWGQRAHERLLRATFQGMPRGEFLAIGRRFAEEGIEKMLAPGALDQVAWHRGRGHECVLITGSLECYMEPWGRAAGFRKVIATRLTYDDAERVEGKFDGGSCWGHAKIVRLIEAVGPLEDYTLVMYGNEPADGPLLRLADHPIPVREGEAWTEIGARARTELSRG